MTMLGALTYHAILALTKDRLAQIEARLRAKIQSQQSVSPLERQVHFLARSAREGLGLAPHLPEQRSLPPFARDLSLHAVAGSIGLSFPELAAQFAPGQRWLVDTLHGGNPDPNRQRVLAGSTDFLLALAERGAARINASDASDKPAELAKLRAHVLGHACRIAADLASAPFVSAATAQLGDGARARPAPDEVAAALDAAAAQLFRHAASDASGEARGEAFEGWWLERSSLPVGFFDAYREALEATYGPGARPIERPSAATTALSPQTSAAFWERFESDAPPALDAALLEDGYDAFRSSLTARRWSFGDWLAGTAWLFFPPIAAYPLIVALPHTRALFKRGALVDGEPVDECVGWFGLVMAPLVTSALAPVILGVYIAAIGRRGVPCESILGLVTGGANLITSVTFLATLGKDVHPAVRWSLLFGLPFVGLASHAAYTLSRGDGGPRRTQLALGSLVSCAVTVTYVLFHLAWHQSDDLGVNGWLKERDGEREGWGNAGFIGGWVLWAALLTGSWLLVSYLLQLGGRTEADVALARQKHFLHLYPHSSLWFDANLGRVPAREPDNPTLATRYFPSDRRPLLTLWWEGPGELWFRSDRNALVFSTSEAGSSDDLSVLAPTTPLTAEQFASYLSQAVRVRQGTTEHRGLGAAVHAAREHDYVLPPGSVFSDGGDAAATLADHDDDARRFVRLGSSRDDATLLYHAPRHALASHQGRRGPVLVAGDRRAAVAGAGRARFDGTTVRGDEHTRFASFFMPGDVIVITGVAGGDEARVVAAVHGDRTLSVVLPFTPEVISDDHAYERAPNTRDADAPAGALTPTDRFRVYRGTGFAGLLMPGDTLRTAPAAPERAEERRVVAVLSATEIQLDAPLTPAPTGSAIACVRVGRLSRDGFAYFPSADAEARDSVVDHAADLGAVLCMGAASHLLSSTERQAVTTGPDLAQRPAIHPVQQVFRNWNLSHRRLNEWQMLISGGAVTEKGGAPERADSLQPRAPSGWVAPTPAGEGVTNRLGWAPLLRRWLEAVEQPGADALSQRTPRAGAPSNRELSEGIAYLFDLQMPS